MYENNYEKYLEDQMIRFESFEGELYKDGIKDTIDHIFPDSKYQGWLFDLCCGDGTTSKFLVEKGFAVNGIDGNSRKIKMAREKNPTSLFLCHDVDYWFGIMYYPSPKYDVIFASHCFEHFLDPMKILLALKTRLNHDGYIVLILPYPNEESEGHPGSAKLKLNGSIKDVSENLQTLGFKVSIEQVNFREPELIIHLR